MDLNLALKSCLIIIFPLMKGISCSVGDNSVFYNRCVKKCTEDSCHGGNKGLIYK